MMLLDTPFDASGFPNPNWLLNALIKPMFDEARIFSEGPVLNVAAAIASVIFLVQLMLGLAELIVNKDQCRLLSARFWFRITFVGGLLIFGRKIFFDPIQTATGVAMDAFANQWVNALERTADAVTAGVTYRMQLLADSDSGGFLALKLEMLWKFVMGAIMTGAGSIVAFVALLLMLLVAIVGCGSISLVCAVAPIYIAFGLSEVTESLATGYFRTWFGTALLYLPFLMLSMKIAVRVSLVALEQWAQPARTNTESFSSFFSMILGPLIGLALIFVGPRVVKSLTGAV